MSEFPQDTILVALTVDPEGALEKPAAELLGGAGVIGVPVALVIAPSGGGDAAAETASSLGAVQTLVAEVPEGNTALGSFAVDALTAAAELTAPDAVLIPNTIDGRDLAGRFAVRSGSALSVDAIGVDRDSEGIVADHSVYGGGYTAQSAPTFGAPVITIRLGSIENRGEAQPANSQVLEVADSGKRASPGDGVRADRRDLVASRAAWGPEGRLRWSRCRLRGVLRARRRVRRRPRCRRRRLPRRCRRRLHRPVAPGRSDRCVRVPAALRRARHLGCDPAQGGYADLEDDRRGEQGRRGADLRHRRLRRRR